MQQIRMSLRGRAEVLMGKNTMMRKAIRGMLDKHPELEKILPCVVGNIGFVFTSEDLNEIRDLLLENKVKAPARAGAIAPVDVTIPAQISRGTIEIVSDVPLIAIGDKVGMSEATLL